MKKLLVLSVLISAQSFAGTVSTKVIYGDDNRIDPINSKNSMFVELTKSTAAMIGASSLKMNAQGSYDILGKSLEKSGICKSERFSEQLSAANCSGFLVDEDLLVTAGHCITGASACEGSKWVFDFKVEFDGQTKMTAAPDAVYSCKKIINRSLNASTKDDWALIQLDRKVLDRRVLKIRKLGKIEKGANLVVIGHPTGIPSKISDGSIVRDLEGTFFTANLDTYGGNSGSAVFDADTGVVEGILVRGATDYVYDNQQRCRVSNVIRNDGGRGEDVTYITNIPELQ